MPRVGDIFQNRTTMPIVVKPDDKMREVHQKLMQSSSQYRCVYVVDVDYKLIGKITLQELLKVIAVRKGITENERLSVKTLFTIISRNLTAQDIMSAPVAVKTTDRLEDSLQKMIVAKLEELAVVDEKGVIIGDLNAYELLSEIEMC